MSGQTEFINFLKSLKPFVNKQGVAALDTLENFFEILEDPKVQRLTNNIQTFTALRKEELAPKKETGVDEDEVSKK